MSVREKLIAVKRVINKKEPLCFVAKDLGVSRQTLYYWIKTYKLDPQKASKSLKDKHLSGHRHYKALSWKIEKFVLDVVVKKPDLSVQKITKLAADAGYKASSHGIYNILVRHNLQTKELRHQFSFAHPVKTLFATSIPALNRSKIVDEYLTGGKNISHICKVWGLSRPTFYSWLGRYRAVTSREKSSQTEIFEALSRNYKSGYAHHNAVGSRVKDIVLDLVLRNPEWSVHTIHRNLVSAGESIGHHGVQNILIREGLNTMTKRQAFAQGFVDIPQVKVAQLYKPEIPVYTWRMLFSPFKTVPKLLATDPKKGVPLALALTTPFFFSFLWLRMVATAPPGTSAIGFFFATIALAFGLFFFIYSLKYYITVLMILKLAQSSQRDAGHTFKEEGNWLQKIIGWATLSPSNPNIYRTNPLLVNLEKVKLEREPFVSIHVALYNERRVVERLIRAATSQEWSNYEVVVADDSTDETTLLVLGFIEKTYGGYSKSIESDGIEVFKAKATAGMPGFTIVHRANRSGFKGAALHKALEYTNPQAEYVTIFDADFVPYPDTLAQFIKSFQEIGGGLANVKNTKIAAVQGYQWHVLNKSQTWVTRGVRTEYAGSYVIERAGEEIYGGLKQISGSVYCIRADVLRQFGWGTSITEDFELTLRLYEAGYKVAFTPYIQAPAEAVSTIKRLIRQRMRWAEGAAFNTKIMLFRMMKSKNMSGAEKFEFGYLAPYYLQAAFFVIGTLSWFISEAVFGSRLPFWTAAFGWSLVFTNIISLPLMNIVGLFLEESDERDYVGILSFIALSYLVVPFQAYAAIKGFVEPQEGPWFRTPKTGMITDTITKSSFGKFFGGILGKRASIGAPLSFKLPNSPLHAPVLNMASSYNPLRGNNFHIRPRHMRYVGNMALSLVIAITLLMSIAAPFIPLTTTYAQGLSLRTVGGDTVQKQSDSGVKEISTSRAIQRTGADGKPIEFIFSKEPKVRIKLDNKEIEFETKRIGDRRVGPRKSLIYGDKMVLYQDAVEGIDIKYTIGDGMVSEEFVIKTEEAIKKFGEEIEQAIQTVDVKVVSPDPSAYGFYTKEGEEIFKLTQPFAKDALGDTTVDVSISVEKQPVGHKMIKKLGFSAKNWLVDKTRVLPIIVDPSVVIASGGVDAEADVNYGSFQRKVAFVNSNWYAFYNCDSATACTASNTDGRIIYKKSSDGVTWDPGVTVDDADTDNYNPTIAVSGNIIHTFWIDNGADLIEGKRINTASADAQGTLCQTSAEAGTINNTFEVSVAEFSATSVLVTYSDTTGGDSEVNAFELAVLDGTCTGNTTSVATGDIVFGSNITAGSRPVILGIDTTTAVVVFQDGTDLSMSKYNADINKWTRNNSTIDSTTNNVFSATTDGTTVWVITVNGATATLLISCCTTDFSAEPALDSDTGSNGQDNLSDFEMFCVTTDDCKIIFADDMDSDPPVMKFVDCNDATCSTSSITTPDSDLNGTSGVTNFGLSGSIYCPSSIDCKIIYLEDVGEGTPLISFADCNDTDCDAPGRVNVDQDCGTTASRGCYMDLYCPAADDCKFTYTDIATSDTFFGDCADGACTNATQIKTTIDSSNSGDGKTALYCVTSSQCKVFYHDIGSGDVSFVDCAAAGTPATCATPPAPDIIDNDVSTTAGTVPLDIDCIGGTADCKLVFGDNTDDDLTFVDCGAADCSTNTQVDIDSNGGSTSSTASSVKMDCVAANDCKILYVGDLTNSEMYFIDCDDVDCNPGSVIEVGPDSSPPRFKGALYCVTTTDCKMAYYSGAAGSAPAFTFSECDVTNCYPTGEQEAVPYTGQTAIEERVSITYDTSNADLYAHIIMDTSDQAYWSKSTATATLSWTTPASYGFTAGDMGEISSPLKGAGTSQVGVVARRGANFEFAPLPERLYLLLALMPFMPKLMQRMRRRGHDRYG